MQALYVLSTSNNDPETKNTIINFIKSNGISIHRWLAEGEHSQWAIECRPINKDINYQLLKKTAEQLGLDINLVSENKRRKKLLLADMDSTLIKGESLDEIASKVGIGEEISKITSQTMNGKLDFKQSIIHRASLLKGVKVAILEEVVKEINLNAGASLLAPTMKKNGAVCYILSGGFDFFTEKIARQLGFEGSFSNSIEVEKSKLTGNVIPPILGMNSKMQILLKLTNKHNVTTDDVVAIGDGANDLEMLRIAGLGIAFNGKPKLKSEIDIQLNNTDLTGLLFLQGYSIKEIYEHQTAKL